MRRSLSFTALFFIEMWERFGYYGMAALLVLFLVQRMHMGDASANLRWGAFSAIVYALPCLGGWIGDSVLGSRRTMVMGAATLLGGYFLLSLPFAGLLYLSLAVIAVGNGLFKANPSNLIGQLYHGEPSQIDSAFTLYYLAVNIGSLISMFLTPIVAALYGWHMAFMLCWIGLALGLANYAVMRKALGQVGSPPDSRPLHWGKTAIVGGGSLATVFLMAYVIQHTVVATVLVAITGLLVISLFLYMIIRGSLRERNGIIVCLVLTLETIAFFVFYQQMSTSLTLFALRNVEHHWLGIPIQPAQFQVLDPLWIVIASPILAWMYNHFGRRGSDLSISTKFALGMYLVSGAFYVYALSGHFAVLGRISAGWMVAGYGLQSLGELLISGLGLAMVSRLVPQRMRGFMMGAWFLGVGASEYLGSAVANLAAVPKNLHNPVTTLPIYIHLFMMLGLAALIIAILSSALVPLLNRLSSAHEQAATGSPTELHELRPGSLGHPEQGAPTG
jgi:POT family proton-dependent oligopeptide transporter